MNRKIGHEPNAGYRLNDRWSVCDVCGRDFRVSRLKETWDGNFVCPADWEPRHKQELANRSGEASGTGVGVSGAGGTFGIDQLNIYGLPGTDSVYNSLLSRFNIPSAKVGVMVVGDESTPVGQFGTGTTNNPIPEGTF